MVIKQFERATLGSPQVGTIHMDAIIPIREALSARGIVRSEQQLEDAWLYLTPFTYSIQFTWREDVYERYELYAEYLSGAGEIRLNGHPIRSFDSGELRADVTAYLEEQNALDITFLPFIPETPMKRFDSGIYANLYLRGSNYITLDSFAVEPEGRGVRASVGLTCHCAGRYDFIYTLSREGALVKKYTFSEKLRALTESIAHELPPVGGADSLRLTIERGGVACDEWDAGLHWPEEFSTLCAVRAESIYLGASDIAGTPLYCAQFEGRSPSLFPRALGLLLLRGGESETLGWPDANHPLCGEILDAALSRALTMRRRPLVSPPSEEDIRSAAGQKLFSRLRLPHAFVDRGENSQLFPGDEQTFAIWFAGDARAPYPLFVSAAIYSPQGEPLASCAFTAYGEDVKQLGEMALRVPEALDYAVVRVATTGFANGESAIHDAFFFRGGLKCAGNLPPPLESTSINGEIHEK